jgi:hypothetical protein
MQGVPDTVTTNDESVRAVKLEPVIVTLNLPRVG